jgi:hypothetical protein
MRRFALFFMLVFGCAAVAHAQEAPAEGDYVLIDKTIKTFYGQVGAVPGADMALQSVLLHQTHQLAQIPGVSMGSAAAAGAVGGAIGGLMIEASIQAARNREIAAIRAPLNDGALKQRVLDSLGAALAEAGHPIARKVLAPEASQNFLRQAVGQARPATVFMFDAKAGPIVSLSGDNKRVVLTTDIAVFERRNNRYTQTRTLRMSYVSRPAPEGADAIAYWAADGAKPVLEAVDDGLRRLVRAGIGPDAVTVPEVDGKAQTALIVNGKPEAVRGVVLASGDGFVTVATPGEWIRILPAELPAAEAPAAPVAAEAPAAKPAASPR